MYHGSMQSGGQGVYLAAVTRELSRLGHDVHVISGPPYPDLDPAVHHHRLRTRSFQAMLLDRPAFVHSNAPLSHLHPLNLYEFAGSRFSLTSLINVFTLRAAAGLAALEAAHGPFDVVHDNQSLGYGLLLIRAALGRPVVANVHHPLDVDARTALQHVPGLASRIRRIVWYPWRMQRTVAHRLDALISGSRASAALVESLWDLSAGSINVIYDGVDPVRFHPDAGEREPGAVLFVGNAEDYNKGVVYLLRAFAALPASLRAHLYLVGGPAGESRVAAAEIARLGIAGRVSIVGRVSDDELARWYRRAQLLASPSLYEGFGLPAAEAMASGVPVVASGAGALPEVVAGGETGILVPARDAAALADAVASLLADPARCARMGAAGRDRVLQRFTWDRHAAGLEDLYRRVTAAR